MAGILKFHFSNVLGLDLVLSIRYSYMGKGLALEKLSHWKNLLARNEVTIFTGVDEGHKTREQMKRHEQF